MHHPTGWLDESSYNFSSHTDNLSQLFDRVSWSIKNVFLSPQNVGTRHDYWLWTFQAWIAKLILVIFYSLYFTRYIIYTHTRYIISHTRYILQQGAHLISYHEEWNDFCRWAPSMSTFYNCSSWVTSRTCFIISVISRLWLQNYATKLFTRQSWSRHSVPHGWIFKLRFFGILSPQMLHYWIVKN